MRAFADVIWVSCPQTFLYGNHVLKSGLARMTENTPQYQGVVVYSDKDIPLVCLQRWMPHQKRSLTCSPSLSVFLPFQICSLRALELPHARRRTAAAWIPQPLSSFGRPTLGRWVCFGGCACDGSGLLLTFAHICSSVSPRRDCPGLSTSIAT